MAVTKTHPIKSTLKASIDYICNPVKTDGQLLVSSYGCTPETADIEFSWTRRQSIDKGTNMGRHLIQAFAPGEVTTEEAHQIGMELAKIILGGKYEFVLATHIDRGHIHNHLLFNSVSFVDYKHYRSNKRSYHEIQRASDRLCNAHGLSIIVPCNNKVKHYTEHFATQAGTSYKRKLKATIDHLIPFSCGFEDLLQRMRHEGYEIKYSKYISCRAPGQKRFTRLKTLGAEYTEESIVDRINSRSNKLRHPKQHDERIRLLVDLQNNPKALQSASFSHWAKLNNLKQAAKTITFLTEHGIFSYEDLDHRFVALVEQRNLALTSIKKLEEKASTLSLLLKYSSTYCKLKPIYDRYRQSKDKEKFLRGHECEITIFEATIRELKKLGGIPPSSDSLKTELAVLAKQKSKILSEYRVAKRAVHEYGVIKSNLESLLAEIPVQKQEQQQGLE